MEILDQNTINLLNAILGGLSTLAHWEIIETDKGTFVIGDDSNIPEGDYDQLLWIAYTKPQEPEAEGIINPQSYAVVWDHIHKMVKIILHIDVDPQRHHLFTEQEFKTIEDAVEWRDLNNLPDKLIELEE